VSFSLNVHPFVPYRLVDALNVRAAVFFTNVQT
jgi:hypothetical protein